MKVLICGVNSKYIHSSLAPWYLKAAACQAGSISQIEVVEVNINQDENMIVADLVARKPDIIAFCCHIWNITMVKLLVQRTSKCLPDLNIILGGPEVSFNPIDVMKELSGVKYLICGEGEVPFGQLLLAIEKNQAISSILGLCYREEDNVVCNPIGEPNKQPPSPYTEEYFQQLHGRIAYFESSRGCPFSCSFCLSGRAGNVRFFDLEQTKAEILQLANSGSKTIKFVDRTFNCQLQRTKEIISFILAKATAPEPEIPAGVCFHFEVGADLFDQQTIDMLNQAPMGLFQLEAGLQSFNSQTLASIQRKTDLRKLKQNIIKLLGPGNIHIHIDLIAGLPFEDLISFASSFDQAYALAPHMLQLGFLKMLHGSKLRQQAKQLGYGFSIHPPYEYTSNPWLSEADKEQLKLCEDALERLANSGRFPTTLDYIFKTTEISAFKFFCEYGTFAGDGTGVPLDIYTEKLYKFALKLPEIRQDLLRDKMVCDRLSFDNTGSLPLFLQIKDRRHNLVARALKSKYLNTKQPFKLYGFALLYAENVVNVVVANYQKKDPVSGRYLLEKSNYEKFMEK